MSKLRSISDLTVLDVGVGMAPAIVAHFLREHGAEVFRVERDDDPFYDVYPAYSVWHEGSQRIGPEALEEFVRHADICLTGGEEWPGLAPAPNPVWPQVSNERLIVLDTQGDIDSRSPTLAVDLLVAASSGLCYEQRSDRPIAFAFQAPTYGAVLLGLAGLFAALLERELTGLGKTVCTSLRRGATLWWSGIWSSAEHPDAIFGNIIPKDVRPLIFKCRDGRYVHFVLGSAGSVAKLFDALEIDLAVDADDRGFPNPAGGPRNYFFADMDLLQRHVAGLDLQELLLRLRTAGIAAEGVNEPGALWEDEQTVASGIVKTTPGGWKQVASPVALQVNDHIQESTRARSPSPVRPGLRIRIVDFGSFVAGPYSSKTLADLGADVIKVEPPGGDPTRAMIRDFSASNRGKRSICIDGKSEAGRELMIRLCQSADAVHHNFRADVAKRLGLDPLDLRRARNDLVIMRTSGYGTRGPKSQYPGFDMVIQACSGLEYAAAGQGNPPMWYRSPVVDYAAGAVGAIATLMGLFEQQRVGAPVTADVSLLSVGMFLGSEVVQSPNGLLMGTRELDKRQTGVHPAEALYQTADGWIAVAARSTEMSARFASVLGVGAELPSREKWDESVRETLAVHIGMHTTVELLDELSKAEVWAVRCTEQGWSALCDDSALGCPSLIGSAVTEERGNVIFVGSLLKQGANALVPNTRVPELGEHTRAILVEMGITEREIEDLFARRVVY